MNHIKLHEQITFLRKQKGITQEELARVLGVTNQAVSKWESGQCCPDIQLLPELAGYFGVSVDALLGYKGAGSVKDENGGKTLVGDTAERRDSAEACTLEKKLLQLRDKIQSLPNPADCQFVLKLAYALHAIFCSKEMLKPGAGNPSWDMEEAIRHASVGEWGLSCIILPEITTYMRRESVFFSSNKNLRMDDTSIRYICGLLKNFADRKNLKTITAIYNLTIHSEEAFVSKAQIVEESELAEGVVENCLEEGIGDYIVEKWNAGEVQYRIKDMYMQVVPLLSMLSITA